MELFKLEFSFIGYDLINFLLSSLVLLALVGQAGLLNDVTQGEGNQGDDQNGGKQQSTGEAYQVVGLGQNHGGEGDGHGHDNEEVPLALTDPKFWVVALAYLAMTTGVSWVISLIPLPWTRNFVVLQGKKSQESFVDFKIF